MRPWPLILTCLAAAACVAAASLSSDAAGATLRLPTEIRMSKADCKEINSKRTLRGRRVYSYIDRTADSVWKSAPVFSGKKADVLAWFKPEPQRRHAAFMGGSYGADDTRNFQYDLLCEELLRSDDLDVVRAVLWNYRGCATGFLRPTWKLLYADPKLNSADRLAAWIRWTELVDWTGTYIEVEKQQDQHRARSWKALAPVMKPDDIIRVNAEFQAWQDWFRSEMWGLLCGPYITEKEAKRILFPIVRPRPGENGHFVRCAMSSLRRFPKLRAQAAANLAAAKTGEPGEALLALAPGDIDADHAAKLRALALSGKSPTTAARAFWTYTTTATGRGELKRDGGSKLLRAYVAGAFEKPDKDARERLAALVTVRPAPGVGEWPSVYLLLKRNNVDLIATPEQFKVLQDAWKKNTPKSLEYIVVEDDEE